MFAAADADYFAIVISSFDAAILITIRFQIRSCHRSVINILPAAAFSLRRHIRLSLRHDDYAPPLHAADDTISESSL